MMPALVAACFGTQDDVAWTVKSRKNGPEFEIVVAGSGPGLRDGRPVGLSFRVPGLHFDWAHGRLEDQLPGEAAPRPVAVIDGRFEHAERWAAPGPVEVRLEREGRTTVQRRARAGTLSDGASALRTASKRLESDLGVLRGLLDDADRLGSPGEKSDQRARELRKRFEWRLRSVRDGLAESPFRATASTASALLADLDAALDLLSEGRPMHALLSTVDGAEFRWSRARGQEARIERLAVHERALAARDLIEALMAGIVEVEAGGDASAWSRFERILNRAAEDLQALGQDGPSGSMREAWEALRSQPGTGLAESMAMLGRLADLAAARLTCPASAGDGFESLTVALAARLARADEEFRMILP
jgi:hypothetical protein